MSTLKVRFFNVGQGNCILVELPPSDASGEVRYGVIDCFYQSSLAPEPLVLSYLKNKQAKVLEFVILTHPDKDHYYGMGALLDYFSTGGRRFKRFIECLVPCDLTRLNNYAPKMAAASVSNSELGECSRELEQIARLAKNAKPDPGYSARPLAYAFKELPLTSDLSIQFISPLEDVYNKVRAAMVENIEYVLSQGCVRPDSLPNKFNANTVSIALSLRFFDARLLICGDVLDPQWNKILALAQSRKLNLRSDLISVSHHGGRGNPKKLWRNISGIKDGRKSVAIISCGYDNNYGHPTESTLNNIFSNPNLLLCTNKGDPCKSFNVLSVHTPFDSAISSVMHAKDGFNSSIDALGASDGACSGTIEVELFASGQAAILHRDQKASCVYARTKGFSNNYPPGI